MAIGISTRGKSESPFSSAITLRSQQKAFFLTIELPGQTCELLRSIKSETNPLYQKNRCVRPSGIQELISRVS
jgi:hypothetical protein